MLVIFCLVFGFCQVNRQAECPATLEMVLNIQLLMIVGPLLSDRLCDRLRLFQFDRDATAVFSFSPSVFLGFHLNLFLFIHFSLLSSLSPLCVDVRIT